MSEKNTTGGARGTVQDPAILRGITFSLAGAILISHPLDGLVTLKKERKTNNDEKM